jgi:hypothetical protein
LAAIGLFSWSTPMKSRRLSASSTGIPERRKERRAAGTSNVYPPVISVTIMSVAIGTWAAQAKTAAMPTITNGAEARWNALARRPPSIAPIEGRVGAEGQPSDPRVKAVGPHDQIHFAPGASGEAEMDTTAVIVQGLDRVAEERLDASVERFVDRGGEVGPEEAGEAAVRKAIEYIDREPASSPTPPIDETHLPHLIPSSPDARDQSHPVRDVVTDTPEVDDVAAGAQARCFLDQEDLVPGPREPVCESRPGDAGAADGNPHGSPASRVEDFLGRRRFEADALRTPLRLPPRVPCGT